MAMGSGGGGCVYSPMSFSCSSASTTSSSSSDDVADPMVKIELEAAAALADLAHLAVRESSAACDSPGEWGSKGKRARKRVKSESPPPDSAFNFNFNLKLNPPLDSLPSDLPQDQAVASQQQCEKICTRVLREPEKDEQDPSTTDKNAEKDSELPKPTPNCTSSYMSFGLRKSKRNLTEAEKEERRIRRVLANRESARQTIRRRQALCEELTRKAADLARENEKLKREKEMASKKYQSLETTNKLFKEHMAKAIKVKVEETPGEHKSANVAASTSSSTNCPLFLYNRPPFMPVFWPSIIPSSNPVQSQPGRQSAIVIPSNVAMPATCRPDISQEQDNHIDVNGPRTPYYVLPCPWFFPLPDQGNGLQPHPSIVMENKHDETSDNNQHSASSSPNTVAHVENHHCSLPIKVKKEATVSTEDRPANDLNETPVGCPLDGGGQHTGAHSMEMLFAPAPQDCVRPACTIKHENRLQSDYTPSENPSTSCHIVSALPENKQESAIYPNKKLMDAVAAAEARKRRKELTKLKNLNGRQCRMHC
uniref:BZIP domain-containing protein n=1 Tax=Fagus sylvatica TaxID=28930 RepID=A0A2N9IE48_FAGSY